MVTRTATSTAATSFGRNGIADWIAQRLSAVILTAYTLFLTAYFLTNPAIDFPTWQALFHQLWMKIFTLLALLSVAVHGWIGLWAG